MDKNEIVSSVSIRFVLSKDEAETIVDSILESLADTLRENKKVDVPKLGEFKIVKPAQGNVVSIEFSPSKKLSKRVNYAFEGLDEIKIADVKPEILRCDDEFNYTVSKEFLEQKKKSEKVSEDLVSVTQETSASGENVKKLISDELVKLHREIIELSNDSKGRSNLWG